MGNWLSYRLILTTEDTTGGVLSNVADEPGFLVLILLILSLSNSWRCFSSDPVETEFCAIWIMMNVRLYRFNKVLFHFLLSPKKVAETISAASFRPFWCVCFVGRFTNFFDDNGSSNDTFWKSYSKPGLLNYSTALLMEKPKRYLKDMDVMEKLAKNCGRVWAAGVWWGVAGAGSSGSEAFSTGLHSRNPRWLQKLYCFSCNNT